MTYEKQIFWKHKETKSHIITSTSNGSRWTMFKGIKCGHLLRIAHAKSEKWWCPSVSDNFSTMKAHFRRITTFRFEIRVTWMPQLTRKYRVVVDSLCIVNFYYRFLHPFAFVRIAIWWASEREKKTHTHTPSEHTNRVLCHHKWFIASSVPDHSSDFVIHSFRTYKYICI